MGIPLKLYHKAFILVSIPLIVQLAVFACFCQTLVSVEEALEEESKATRINYHLNKLNFTLLAAARSLQLSTFRLGSKNVGSVQEKLKEADTEFAQLHKLLEEHPNHQQTLKQMQATVDMAYGLVRDADRNNAKGNFDAARADLSLLRGMTPELVNRMGDVSASADKLTGHAVEDESKQSGDPVLTAGSTGRLSRVLEHAARFAAINKNLEQLTGQFTTLSQESLGKERAGRRMLAVFTVLSVVNMALAIVLLFIYNRDITQRLKVLMENTARFMRGAQLQDPIPGSDEISSLDKIFHDMATVVAAAARQKQEFTAMITHDLRTPLTSIKGGLHLVQINPDSTLSESSTKLIKNMESATDMLIKLINDLLDVEKLEAGKMDMVFEDVPMAYVLEQSLEAVRFLAQKKSVKIEMPACDLEIHADGDRLVQVLINLLSNAIKYSPKEAVVCVSLKEEQNWLEVRVTDQGPGIPEEYKEKLFQRFQQVNLPERRSYGGTGLGLAICKEIVNAHDGQVGIESVEGQGSTFWFKIPYQAKAVRIPAAAEKVE